MESKASTAGARPNSGGCTPTLSFKRECLALMHSMFFCFISCQQLQAVQQQSSVSWNHDFPTLIVVR